MKVKMNIGHNQLPNHNGCLCICISSIKQLSTVFKHNLPPLNKSNQHTAKQISKLLTSSSFNGFHNSPLFSNLNPHITHMVLIDPLVPATCCLRFFDFLRNSPSLSSQRADFRAHIDIIFRSLEARKFDVAKDLLKSMFIDKNFEFGSLLEECGSNHGVMLKFYQLLMRVYADNKDFDDAFKVFDYMSERGLRIEERSCVVLLLSLKNSRKFESVISFLRR